MKRNDFEITDIQDLKFLDNKNIHNFSLGCLFSYFYFSVAEKTLYTPGILHLKHRGKARTFVFDFNRENKGLLRYLSKFGVIYSLDPIPFEPFNKKQGKFQEVGYRLTDLFNPASYRNAKKRHQRLTYPFNWLKKEGITCEPITRENIMEVKQLHDKWVDYKLNDENTFRIMFPTGRYMKCCNDCVERVNKGFFDTGFRPFYRSSVFRLDGKVCAVRVVSVQDFSAYDLAFFGNTWSAPSQLLNYCNIAALADLHDNGVDFFNCGASLNKQLKAFKVHYPNEAVISYTYPRMK